jgi:hypothetical protein
MFKEQQTLSGFRLSNYVHISGYSVLTIVEVVVFKNKFDRNSRSYLKS